MKNTSYKGSDLSQSFKSYSRKVCKLIANQLLKVNGQITDFNIGFYYFSGFFTVKGKIFYFCSYDYRYYPKLQMYFRTAKNNRDFTGGVNMPFDVDNIVNYFTYGNIIE